MFKIMSLLRSLRTLNRCLKGFKGDITEAQEISGSVTLLLKYPTTLCKYQWKKLPAALQLDSQIICNCTVPLHSLVFSFQSNTILVYKQHLHSIYNRASLLLETNHWFRNSTQKITKMLQKSISRKISEGNLKRTITCATKGTPYCI